MTADLPGSSGLYAEYRDGAPAALGDDVLAVFVFGARAPPAIDPRVVHIDLAPVAGNTCAEIWRSPGPVTTGIDGRVRFAVQQDFLFGSVEVSEAEFGGLSAAAEAAYDIVLAFQLQQSQRHLLRAWNFLDAINQGCGDDERYRQFCAGRARALTGVPVGKLPAGTAVGRKSSRGTLQVCWLAGRQPGLAIENPRQMRAYRYPPRYGPSPPSFARAMLLHTGDLMISGTASIVGHESLHDDNLAAQVDEILTNLSRLREAATNAATNGTASMSPRAPTLLRAYLRKVAPTSAVADQVRAGMASCSGLIILEADLCRGELLVEIECAPA